MASYKNVPEECLNNFIDNLPDELELQLQKDDPNMALYKTVNKQVTLTYYKTTCTTLIQGNPLSILDHLNIFQKVYDSYSAASSNANPHTNAPAVAGKTNNRKNPGPYARGIKPPEIVQVHNLRFNDFRDDIVNFIRCWKPLNHPSQSQIELADKVKIVVDTECQTDIDSTHFEPCQACFFDILECPCMTEVLNKAR